MWPKNLCYFHLVELGSWACGVLWIPIETQRARDRGPYQRNHVSIPIRARRVKIEIGDSIATKSRGSKNEKLH